MDIIILILYTFARVFRDFLERLLTNYAGCKYAAEAVELGVRNEEFGIRNYGVGFADKWNSLAGNNRTGLKFMRNALYAQNYFSKYRRSRFLHFSLLAPHS